jgi:hypothetical protein
MYWDSRCNKEHLYVVEIVSYSTRLLWLLFTHMIAAFASCHKFYFGSTNHHYRFVEYFTITYLLQLFYIITKLICGCGATPSTPNKLTRRQLFLFTHKKGDTASRPDTFYHYGCFYQVMIICLKVLFIFWQWNLFLAKRQTQRNLLSSAILISVLLNSTERHKMNVLNKRGMFFVWKFQWSYEVD